MNLKGLLRQIMYRDRLAVYRLVPEEAADGSDDYAAEEQEIFSDIPCKLSQYGKGLLATKKARGLDITLDLRVTLDPDVGIQEGDRLVVLHQGQVFDLYAGTRFAYPTHQEISVRRKGEAQDGSAL